MNIVEQKRNIRKAMFRKRAEFENPEKNKYDKWVCDEIEKLILLKNYKTVHAYIPILTEINILPLLQRLINFEIKVICPKTLPKRKLENRILHSLEDLDIGIMGTKFPSKLDLHQGKIDLIIVPGLAFDNRKNRVGYGGGYYDNLLAKEHESFKLGIFYPFQKVDIVPLESHDIQLDAILVKK